MGNLTCLTRKDEEQQPTTTNIFVSKKFTSLNLQAKYKFLYCCNIDFLCGTIQAMKESDEPPNPYNSHLTKKIMQLQVVIQNLPQLDAYLQLREVYTEYSYLRMLILMQDYNLQKCLQLILEDITFKSCIRIDLSEPEMLREIIFFAGEDFNRSLCLAIKINLYRGKLKTQAIRSYVSFFIENFWFEMAKRNQLNHELTILIDCGESDLDIKLIQYLMNLTLKHYLLKVTKIYVVNMNIGKISSETGATLSQPLWKRFVFPFGDDYKKYLPRYLRKSTLVKEYGGHYPNNQRMPIPLNIEEARSVIF